MAMTVATQIQIQLGYVTHIVLLVASVDRNILITVVIIIIARMNMKSVARSIVWIDRTPTKQPIGTFFLNRTNLARAIERGFVFRKFLSFHKLPKGDKMYSNLMERNHQKKNIAAIISLLLLTTVFVVFWGNNDRSEYEQAVLQINDKAIQWLDTLDIDPIELRYEQGIKGKKHFVELLMGYFVLYETGQDEQLKNEYKAKAETIVEVTNDPEYHDMGEVDDTQFRQDATSYLRAWYIMNEFGFDTTYYEAEIAKVIPRIDDHLPTRGINQRMSFVIYYEKLGYPIDYTMEELFSQSLIRNRPDAQGMTLFEYYVLTHNVLALYDAEKMDILTDDDMAYLERVIPELVNQTILEKNVDILAEFITVMTYLDFDALAEYDLAIEFLLSSQNEDGWFGDYEFARDYVESYGVGTQTEIMLLHPTEASLWALNEACPPPGSDCVID
jgi:hypothetical protein